MTDHLAPTLNRDSAALLIAWLGVIVLLISVVLLVSFGIFVGLGVGPLLSFAVCLSPSPTRRRLAVLGVSWSVFCLVLLVVAWVS